MIVGGHLMSSDTRPRYWITDPADHVVLVSVDVDVVNKTYRAVLADGLTVVVGSPELASALGRCLLMCTEGEHVPVFEIKSNQGRPVKHLPSI